MELIREVGALAGLAAFVGLAVLALLYFAQARDLRRLRESASFLVEGSDQDAAPAARTAATRRAPVAAGAAAAPQAEAESDEEPAASDDDAEAFRRAELARQAEERRRRFEERRRQEEGGAFSGVSGRWIAIAGALILIAGVAFGATRILGGDEATQGGNRVAANNPGQVRVAVFNGTAEPGLAADFAQTMQQVTGYQPDPITNTDSPFETSSVMFESGARGIANEVARALGISEVAGMDPEIRRSSDQAPVAVILGDDKATGA